ncbi:MAG TPA: molecular chaperone TorD family protein [Candidatus Angelobacter sp.]|nr:molecular chaperone TorD family protein [Candidatus Angelobacter sp.]
MTLPREQLEAVAALFTYPRTDYMKALENAVARSDSATPALLEFAGEIRRMSLSGLQELYTSTFDLSPVCALDLGWHLFGEDYKRGLLLARMRRELLAHGIPETVELPDHLSHALLLLARMKPAQAEEFAFMIVAPAVERILNCMPSNNLFSCLVQAVQQLITFHFPAPFEPVPLVAEGAML